MKNVNKYILLGAIFLLSGNIVAKEVETPKTTELEKTTNQVEPTKDLDWGEKYIEKFGVLKEGDLVAKQLTGGQVSALEYVLSQKKSIFGLVVDTADKVDMANKFLARDLEETLKENGVPADKIETVKKEVVSNLVVLIEAPVSDFLENLQQDWCRDYFDSLLKQIFQDSKVPLAETWVTRFLTDKSGKVKTYLSRNIKTDKDLNNVVKELQVIFDSFKKTMPKLFAK